MAQFEPDAERDPCVAASSAALHGGAAHTDSPCCRSPTHGSAYYAHRITTHRLFEPIVFFAIFLNVLLMLSFTADSSSAFPPIPCLQGGRLVLTLRAYRDVAPRAEHLEPDLLGRVLGGGYPQDHSAARRVLSGQLERVRLCLRRPGMGGAGAAAGLQLRHPGHAHLPRAARGPLRAQVGGRAVAAAHDAHLRAVAGQPRLPPLPRHVRLCHRGAAGARAARRAGAEAAA